MFTFLEAFGEELVEINGEPWHVGVGQRNSQVGQRRPYRLFEAKVLKLEEAKKSY